MIFHYGKILYKINKLFLMKKNNNKRFNEGEAIANMVVEISRWSHAKLELNPKEQLNPIYHVSNLCVM